MLFGSCCNGFLPGGKDAYIAAALIGFISACGYYTYNQINQKICNVNEIHISQPPALFHTENACIPKEQIVSGGVKKDAIPSLTNPKMIAAEAERYLEEDDRVVGILIGDKALAYPLRILAWHECVNESIQGTHFSVIYCPLCDSTSVFNREVNGKVLEFGISGYLYQSNVLLYNRQDAPQQESLWSQMQGKAVSGPMVETQLNAMPHQLVTWRMWKELHPDTLVLSNETGHVRDYVKDYYPQYFASPELMFPVEKVDKRFLLKDIVIGVHYNGVHRAYPIEHFQMNGKPVEDTIGDKKVVLTKHSTGSISIHADDGVEIFHSFWFAWYAFHPETEIYSGDGFNLNEWLKINQSSL